MTTRAPRRTARLRKLGWGRICTGLTWLALGRLFGLEYFGDWPILHFAAILTGLGLILFGSLSTLRRRWPVSRIWCFRIAAVLLGVLVPCLVLEVSLRLFDIRGYHCPRKAVWEHALVPSDELLPGCHLQFKPNVVFEHVYDSNPNGYFNERNAQTYRTNRYGLRGPDFLEQKEPGVTRVLVLGDSFVFGEGVEFEDTVTAQLQLLLNARGSETFEVINAAAGAWDTDCEVNYLERQGVAFEPDIIMVGYVLNDAPYDVGLDMWDNITSTYQNRKLRGSYLISYLYGVIAQRTLTRRFVAEMAASACEHRDEWEFSFAALSRGQKIAASIGARYIVFIYPFMYELSDHYPFIQLHAMVADYCRTHGIEVIDLLPHYMGLKATALWVHPSDPHPDAVGHGVAAGALADYLVGR